jgi:hypothetical protein
MCHIYEGASSVLIWLGEGTKNSDRATSLIRKLSNAATIAGPTIPNSNIMNSKDLTRYELPSLFGYDYVSLLLLLETQ